MATCVYTAGYVTVPDRVKQAATMIVEQLYRQTSGDDKQLVRFKIGDISETYKNAEYQQNAMAELGIKGSQTIIKLLRPYCQPFRRFGFAGVLG